MTLIIFLGSLVGFMALGMPIAFALVLTGVALMFHLDFFDAQLIAQNMLAGADNFPLMAPPRPAAKVHGPPPAPSGRRPRR